MRKKAESNSISFVLVVMITIVGISVVLSVGMPAIYSFRDAAAIKSAESNMEKMDQAIRDVSSQSDGTLRKVRISSEGTYRVLDQENSVQFSSKLDTRLDLLNTSSGNIMRNFTASGSGTQMSIKLTYSNIQIGGDLRIGRGYHSVCVEKWTNASVNLTSC